MKNNVCIIGASVTSCILGIYLKKRGHKVILLEKGSKIGGAWQVDNQGSIFSNIVAPINNEVKNFSKVVIFLKRYGVKFNKEYQKALFTKRIIKVKSSDFRSLIKNSKKKLDIVYNYERWSINVDKSITFVFVEKGSNYLINEFPTQKEREDAKEKIKDI